MNERIEKIKFECLDWNVWTGRWELNANKFAELIVRECAELATKEYNNRGAIHGNDLLEHFGVEE